ncbi:Uncharacterised protein [Klebsiella pneumoniae]|nr:Uncharacterised protein [Klebsiella pneumoniae]
MQYAILNPCRTVNRIKVKAFAEGIAEIETQFTQQGIHTQQTQQLASVPGTQVGKLPLAQVAFNDAIERRNIG